MIEQPDRGTQGRPSGRGRRGLRIVAALAVAAGAVLGGVLFGPTALDAMNAEDPDDIRAATAAERDETAASSAPSAPPTPSRRPAQRVDLDRPYERTAAAGWAEGAAGIVEAEAVPVGDHDAEEVATAVEAVREAVIAARLDPRSLTEHDPEGYLSLLAPDLQAGLREAFAEDDVETGLWITRIGEDDALLPVPPRVEGEMTVELDEDGEILVRTNYLFAYAFEPPADVEDLPGLSNTDLVVFHRIEQDFSYVTGQEWADSSHGLWAEELVSFSYGMACDLADRGFLAPAFAETDQEVDAMPDEAEIQGMFDATRPMPTEGNC
ncbi:hypothetical protein FHR81_001433 [Actinoalloteichus hoggarensis]|uniref:Uncharacterized protein n=1 Tax=Actinoalloteichus hoggarensis TaxID=1470176 RepID=A0A221W075_9PSEU|nr:hypothetical protein [Actinoalloteichus hoggarensis]ASO19167.1 hypothetical protein AHOG_07610 [Actinoalloteichus hoggarensis]MBB5920403.1 hypothetical protein [Actinoalloteichus hoggarensis]